MSDKIVASYRIDDLDASSTPALTRLAQSCHQYPMSTETINSCFGRFYHVLGLYDGQALVGACILYLLFEDATIIDICIEPSQQGKGLGRRLLMTTCDKARALAADRVMLEVRASNSGAIELYRKLGFKQTSVRAGYYPAADGREDAILMELGLALD
ncbi:ribosomal protein S18-alanine N-acetyltransferase [Shewanella waksmanii]|uniref:ribosomal protein S18-alanine N-acetyltransferase n=1 Tax=Shewanella waksmanii TaxID=213783 RepID=UPI0004B4E660|nr:ribosomal protein S18-alanine N-acetyltransferase [Shewanella waksmanii]